MAMNFENLVIDRPLQALFRNHDKEVLGGLNQIQGLSIATSSETKDKTDATGVLIKRFYTSKSVEISAENAVLSLSLMGIQTGNGKEVADASHKIKLPMIARYKVADAAAVTLSQDPIDGIVTVIGLTPDGLPDTTRVFTLGTNADNTHYAITERVLTLPTYDDSDSAQTPLPEYIQVSYEYESESAVRVLQSGDKFPAECELWISVLVCETCDKETLRHAWVVFPSFQMSPDFDLTMDTDSAHPFSGVAAVDYCSADKAMFYIAISEDDVE